MSKAKEKEIEYGKAFSYVSASPNTNFPVYFKVGRLALGWGFTGADWQMKHVAYQWPYAKKRDNLILIPFPASAGEWIHLRQLFNKIEVPLPGKEEYVGGMSVSNAGLRFDLSHSPKIGVDISVPGLKVPVGFESPMFPFQYVAVRYAESLGFRALIGDDMGLGKTVVGLASALKAGARKIIVVTRSVALGSWTRAIKSWTDYNYTVALGTSPIKSKRKDGSINLKDNTSILNFGLQNFEHGIVVLNYDILAAWAEELYNFNADFIIFDEVHAVKDPNANRSKVAYKLMDDIDCVLGLTGTPISNRPIELYHIANRIHPGKWGEFFNYARRYCDAKQKVISERWVPVPGQYYIHPRTGRKTQLRKLEQKKAWDFSGSSHEKELYRRLRSTLMVRRIKDEVLDLLPPIEDTIALTPSKRYWDAEKGILPLLEANSKADDKSINAKTELSLHELFAAAAMDKIDWAEEWLKAFLEDTDQKIVIFFHYQHVGKALSEMLSKWNVQHVNLWGGSPDKDGDHTFQTVPECRVALCSYGVAREAVTLTAASYQLMMEYPWVPGWAEQARDRTRRIGQMNAVTYYYPVLVGSAEERIVMAMLKKQDIISIITQGIYKAALNIDRTILNMEV